jgi:hypothetical protein
MMTQILWGQTLEEYLYCCEHGGVFKVVDLKVSDRQIDGQVERHVGFEVFMAVNTKNGVFWDATPCGSCKKSHTA